MSPSALIADLQRRRITLSVVNGQLHVSPKSLLKSGDRETIRAHLPQIVTALAPAATNPDAAAPPGAPFVGTSWDPDAARRMIHAADDLITRYAVSGCHPAVAAAAATVFSAFEARDMETLRFAIAEFELVVRMQATVEGRVALQ